MPLSLKTVEVQIKGEQWNKKFRTVQVYSGNVILANVQLYEDYMFCCRVFCRKDLNGADS